MPGEEKVADVRVPAWLRQLAAAAGHSDADELDRRMRPPADGSGRRAAVLIAFCEVPGGDESAAGPAVLLTERALGLRSHAGQAAFPGGGVEPEDRDGAATAIREAGEEVGLDPGSVQVLGYLPERYLPASDFVVTPVLAWWAEPHPVEAVDEGEVARAVIVPVAELAAPANRFQVLSPRSDRYGPGFEIGTLFIWGFTAALLDHILRLGRWEQPWDHAVTRTLPDASGPSR